MPRSVLFQPLHTVALVAVLALVPGASPIAAAEAAARKSVSSDLVALSKVDASIAQDMRYAGPHNFTGRIVPGYEAPQCLLRPAVADALARVQADLAKAEPPLSLKVFDCYRPQRSVRSFMAWAADKDDGSSRVYHPGLPRGALVAKGYIARTSTHSRGIAVDLTLTLENSTATGAAAAKASASKQGPCTGDRSAGDSEIDMGSGFDCFDPKSHTAAGGIAEEQRDARQLLKRAMSRHGFVNYAREWWHFTYPAADDGRSFDVPVR